MPRARRAIHQNQIHPGLGGQFAPGRHKPTPPRQLHAPAGQHLTEELHGIAMEQGLLVINGQVHQGKLEPLGRKIAVGQANGRQSLHPGLLQPGQIGAMPHHAGMVGVLGQHPPFQ